MTALATARSSVVGPRYKWVVLSNTTIGVVLATMNATSLIIALPVIFRGIHLNPLQPANFPYLLWIIMGYMLVSAAVVVTVGRIGDIFGRVRLLWQRWPCCYRSGWGAKCRLRLCRTRDRPGPSSSYRRHRRHRRRHLEGRSSRRRGATLRAHRPPLRLRIAPR